MSAMRWDAVIAGGGAGGLSLAGHLAAGGWRDRAVLVVDDGSRPLDGRSWAFWSSTPGLLDAAVDRTFDRFRICGDGRTLVVRLNEYRYRVVSGARLRRAVTALVARAPGFREWQGHVETVADSAEGAVVTVDGRPVEAHWAFDSVTREAAVGPPAWLTFTGWEVETPHDSFDPTVPTLMDFRTPQGGEVRFVYVLPSGPRRALVEHTRFGGGGDCDGDAAVAAYLDDVVRARAYQVVRREDGHLPLQLPGPRPHTGHVLPIGVHGGMLKASTGYAYARIQRDSVAIAAALAGSGRPFPPPSRRQRHTFLDAVLLDVLAAEPARVPQIFVRLFERNSADRVLRFLDEATSLLEEARLVCTLPPAPFARAMIQRVGPRTAPG